MPELIFKGKEFVYNHHLAVPFRPLVPHPDKSIGEARMDGNLIIHGDNLLALKSLLPMYAGKVDCVFIDPPYNTGNEGWGYNDNVNSPLMQEWLKSNPVGIEDGLRHDKWLAMMWPRLRLLHELLADHGVLWMTLDANETHRAISLIEGIFGEGEILSVITTEANPRGRQSDTFFATVNDYLICVAKNKDEASLRGLPASEEYSDEFKNVDADGSKWRELGLRQRGADSLRSDREDMHFDIYVCPTDGSISLEKTAIHTEKVVPKKSDGRDGRWSWSPEYVKKEISRVYGRKVKGRDGQVRFDVFYKDSIDRGGEVRRQKPRTMWPSEIANTEIGGTELTNIFGKKMFDYPKPRSLLEAILEISTTKNSLILDSFAGSGTTAHAVLATNKKDGGNRKFILVECEDYADTLTAERVRRVIGGYDFQGTQREELLKKTITFTDLKKADKLLDQIASIENLDGHRFDKIEKKVSEGKLLVEGVKSIAERTEGLGGSFTFCTLGAAIEMDKMLTGETLPTFEQLGALLYHMATNESFDAAMSWEKEGHGYLGESTNFHVWLIYQPNLDFLKSRDAALTLSKAKALVEAKSGKRHLVFAPAKFVSQKLLAEAGLPVEFAPLPFALYRIERS